MDVIVELADGDMQGRVEVKLEPHLVILEVDERVVEFEVAVVS